MRKSPNKISRMTQNSAKLWTSHHKISNFWHTSWLFQLTRASIFTKSIHHPALKMISSNGAVSITKSSLSSGKAGIKYVVYYFFSRWNELHAHLILTNNTSFWINLANRTAIVENPLEISDGSSQNPRNSRLLALLQTFPDHPCLSLCKINQNQTSKLF